MAKSHNTWFLVVILAGIATTGAVTPAHAGSIPFRLRLDAGADTGPGVVITDNGPGDLIPTPGIIRFAGSVGSFTTTISTGLSKPITGTTQSSLVLDSMVTASTTGGTLRIFLEDGDFAVGAPPLVGNFGGIFIAPPGSSITAASWVNPNNLVPDYGADRPTVGTLTGDPDSVPVGSVEVFGGSGVTFVSLGLPLPFATTASTSYPGSSSFSLFTQVNITMTQAGMVQFSESQTVLPGPAGLVLALAALPAFGLGYFRRRFQKKA